MSHQVKPKDKERQITDLVNIINEFPFPMPIFYVNRYEAEKIYPPTPKSKIKEQK